MLYPLSYGGTRAGALGAAPPHLAPYRPPHPSPSPRLSAVVAPEAPDRVGPVSAGSEGGTQRRAGSGPGTAFQRSGTYQLSCGPGIAASDRGRSTCVALPPFGPPRRRVLAHAEPTKGAWNDFP